MANEKRLIDANYFVNKGIRNCPIEEGGIPLRDFHQHQKILALYPTVDAVEVVHGYNIDRDTPSLFECSVCHWSCWDTYCGDTEDYNYCPNCGAKMDEEAV
jgi:hypothetical protein